MILNGRDLLTYETLLIEADSGHLVVKEKNLKGNDGRISGNRIAIRKEIPTVKKACVLAEELGHYYTTTGNILDQSTVENRKQELRARLWSYNKMIGLTGIIKSYEHGCQTLYDMAEYLNVTEEFLSDAISQYRKKYGVCTELDNYVIFFEPRLSVLRKLQD